MGSWLRSSSSSSRVDGSAQCKSSIKKSTGPSSALSWSQLRMASKVACRSFGGESFGSSYLSATGMESNVAKNGSAWGSTAPTSQLDSQPLEALVRRPRITQAEPALEELDDRVE